MYCRQCGYNNDQYSKVCKRCGSIIRDAEDLYDRDDAAQDELPEGALKYARKGEDLVTTLKAPFRRLERASRKQKTSIMAAIAAAIVVLCLASWLIAVIIRANRVVVETVYGNTSANIAQNALAASDGGFIYYTCPFGENPGLYRLAEATGETLKINYLCLEQLSACGGWVYGVTADGSCVRISSDGLTVQQVIDEQHPGRITVVDDKMYYLGKGAHLYCADLDTVSRRSTARTELVCTERVTEFIVYDDVLYYIPISEDDYTALFTQTFTDMVEGEDGKKTEYSWTELVEPNGSEVTEHPGFIYSLSPDADEPVELLSTPVKRLTAADGYMFFQSEVTVTVSATDVDPNAPPDMDYEYLSTNCWRLELATLKYSSMLGTDVAASPMNPGSDGYIYYINTSHDMARTTVSGKESTDVLTYAQRVDRVTVLDGRAFILADGGTRLMTVALDGSGSQVLCEAAQE